MDDRQSNRRIVLPKSIAIKKHHLDTLVKHAKSTFPDESCALLFGKDEDDQVKISEVFLVENSQKSQTRFSISNEDLIRGYRDAESAGLDVVGIFHSHPHSEAAPSAMDKRFMEVNPVVWVIFSNKSGQFKAYVLENEAVPLTIKIV
ncbi:Mov34/MPN/PAD-1 family protein [Candidatus Nitrosotenuis uzonensis]|uniref:Mov34/MPN/PAD-1 family protein n=1 Tax=Candidatus Nitrosotenuis uzonensis TaxID=1407055 RepID=A0A812EWL5_9ARCH|nr:Mov34/MPN/PAD-1 family protein [Candidatus Nitrosotenuis uzonensis]